MEAVENNIKEIWNECEAEIEKMHKEREMLIEEYLEKALNEKAEKIAAVKAKYDSQIKDMELQIAKSSMCWVYN